jgi:hypothetical protein
VPPEQPEQQAAVPLLPGAEWLLQARGPQQPEGAETPPEAAWRPQEAVADHQAHPHPQQAAEARREPRNGHPSGSTA